MESQWKNAVKVQGGCTDSLPRTSPCLRCQCSLSQTAAGPGTPCPECCHPPLLQAAQSVARLVEEEGYLVCVTHGNGPQVGLLALQVRTAALVPTAGQLRWRRPLCLRSPALALVCACAHALECKACGWPRHPSMRCPLTCCAMLCPGPHLLAGHAGCGKRGPDWLHPGDTAGQRAARPRCGHAAHTGKPGVAVAEGPGCAQPAARGQRRAVWPSPRGLYHPATAACLGATSGEHARKGCASPGTVDSRGW